MGGVDLALLDAAPVTPVGEPDGVVRVDEDIEVDGVEVIAGVGGEDLSLIDPLVGGIGGVQRGIGFQADDGGLAIRRSNRRSRGDRGR